MVNRTNMLSHAFAWMALTLLGVGCSADQSLEVSFADGVPVDDVVAVTITITEGGCDGGGEELYRSAITRMDAGMDLPDLSPGSYAVRGVAHDAMCGVVAERCQVVEIPSSSDVVSLVLGASSGDACVAGMCTLGSCGGLDGGADVPMGMDGGFDSSVDAGPPDAQPDVFDAGNDAGPTLEAPIVVSPWNGVTTGSALAPTDTGVVDAPLRPLVRWEESERAESYVVEFSACDSWPDCDFAEVAARVVTAELQARPDSPLRVELDTAVGPLGARYAFRVGACVTPAGMACVFSDARYLDVGRVKEDVDGDGDGDLFTINGRDASSILVQFSTLGTGQRGNAVVASIDLQIGTWIGDYDGDGVGELAVLTGAFDARRVRFFDDVVDAGSIDAGDASDVHWLGDVDADGFTDFAFVTEGEVRVQLGGATFNAGRTVQVRDPGDVIDFAEHISTAGDRDGDGAADLAVVSRIAADMMRVDVYSLAERTPERLPGSFSFSTGEAGDSFGDVLAITGGIDMDGNGRPEFAIARPLLDRLSIYFDDGRQEGITGFGWETEASVAMGLLDGTPRGRVAVGASEALDATFGETGGMYHVAYTVDPLFATTRIRVFNEERFGRSNATVDLQGSGRQAIVTLAANGMVVHVGLFTEDQVGGQGLFLFPSGGSFSAIAQ
ncbi:MAG: FG-GAP repeat domain-containing protein [Polyangiales bacterium]